MRVEIGLIEWAPTLESTYNEGPTLLIFRRIAWRPCSILRSCTVAAPVLSSDMGWRGVGTIGSEPTHQTIGNWDVVTHIIDLDYTAPCCRHSLGHTDSSGLLLAERVEQRRSFGRWAAQSSFFGTARTQHLRLVNAIVVGLGLSIIRGKNAPQTTSAAWTHNQNYGCGVEGELGLVVCMM